MIGSCELDVKYNHITQHTLYLEVNMNHIFKQLTIEVHDKYEDMKKGWCVCPMDVWGGKYTLNNILINKDNLIGYCVYDKSKPILTIQSYWMLSY